MPGLSPDRRTGSFKGNVRGARRSRDSRSVLLSAGPQRLRQLSAAFAPPEHDFRAVCQTYRSARRSINQLKTARSVKLVSETSMSVSHIWLADEALALGVWRINRPRCQRRGDAAPVSPRIGYDYRLRGVGEPFICKNGEEWAMPKAAYVGRFGREVTARALYVRDQLRVWLFGGRVNGVAYTGGGTGM